MTRKAKTFIGVIAASFLLTWGTVQAVYLTEFDGSSLLADDDGIYEVTSFNNDIYFDGPGGYRGNNVDAIPFAMETGIKSIDLTTNRSGYGAAGGSYRATSVPEPKTLFLIGTGLAGITIIIRRRKK